MENPTYPNPLMFNLTFLETKEGKKARIGTDYQALIPDVVKPNRRALYNYLRGNPALPYWCPTDSLTDKQIEAFVSMAKKKYHYTEEQALGVLNWHEHDVSKAIKDMSQFCPKFEEWTEDDEVYFKESLRLDRKNVLGISRKMGKSMNTILLHYYKLKSQKKRKNKSIAKIKKEVPDMDACEFHKTLANIKQEPQDEGADEFNYTLANMKHEVEEEEDDEVDLTILRIKQEPF